VRRRQTWLAYAAGALVAAAVIGLGASVAWDVERHLYWIRGSAWCALIALALTLCASPIGRALRRLGHANKRVIDETRRALGITTSALATLHVALALSTYLRDAWREVLELTWLRSGAVAFAILLALWLTSYPALNRRLRVLVFKPLHRLAWVAFALAAHHALTSPFAPRGWVAVVVVVVLVVAPLRLLRARPKTETKEPGAA